MPAVPDRATIVAHLQAARLALAALLATDPSEDSPSHEQRKAARTVRQELHQALSTASISHRHGRLQMALVVLAAEADGLALDVAGSVAAHYDEPEENCALGLHTLLDALIEQQKERV